MYLHHFQDDDALQPVLRNNTVVMNELRTWQRLQKSQSILMDGNCRGLKIIIRSKSAKCNNTLFGRNLIIDWDLSEPVVFGKDGKDIIEQHDIHQGLLYPFAKFSNIKIKLRLFTRHKYYPKLFHVHMKIEVITFNGMMNRLIFFIMLCTSEIM